MKARLRASALAVGLACALAPRRAEANEGTIKHYVMPYAAALGTMLPHANVYVASRSGTAGGYGFRLAPISFFAQSKKGTIVLVPFTDFDVVPSRSWEAPHARVAHGTQAMWFLPELAIGLIATGGASVGLGGPSGFVGGGVVAGDKMGTVRLTYQRSFGRDEDVHTLTFGFGLTYPFRMGPRHSED